MKNTIRKPIKRKLVLLIVIFFVLFTVVVAAEGILDRIERYYDAVIRNQYSHRRLGRVLIRELISTELAFNKMILIDDQRDLDVLEKRLCSSIEVIESVLEILQNGGEFEDVMAANFNDVDKVTEKYSYHRDNGSGYVIEVIDLTPKIEDIRQIVDKLIETVSVKLAGLEGNAGQVAEKRIHLLSKQADTFLLRSRESAGKLFYDGHIAIKRLEREKAESLHLFSLIRYVVIAVIGAGVIIICVLTIFRVGNIIKERDAYTRNLYQANKDLIDKQNFFNAILDATPAGIVVIDAETHKITRVNKSAAKLFGGTAENIIGSICHKFICPAEDGQCPITDKKQKINNSNHILLTADGEEVDILKSAVSVTLDGRACLVESFVDIGDIKKAQDKLRSSEEKFRTLYDSSSEAVMLLDKNDFLDCNNAALEIFDCASREEFYGKHLTDMLPPVQSCGTDSVILAHERIETALEEGSNRFEWTFKRFNGTEFPAEVLLKSMDIGGKKVLQAVVRDITEQKQAEEKLEKYSRNLEQMVEERTGELKTVLENLQNTQSQLLQSEKMASIGQLAAGVAHEINNPIGFISSNLNSLGEYIEDIKRMLAAYEELLELCQQDQSNVAPQAEKVRGLHDELDINYVLSDLNDLIKESVDGTDRVRKIISDLRDFSHVDSPDVSEENINDLLDKTISVAWNELKYKTEVVKEYGDITAIPCYGGKLGQVFLNLLVNAAQAIEEHGQITVRTGGEDKQIWIEIADTGSGIPSENLNKIFDPFFTTKEVGKGTGLGLNLAYNIIEAHGGSINVKSTVGEGTTFRIELPVTGPAQSKESVVSGEW